MRTNGDRLNLNAFLDMGSAGVVGLLVRENGLAAESVDKGCPACRKEQRLVGVAPCRVGRYRLTSSRGAANHQAELDSLLDILLAADHLLCRKHVSVAVRIETRSRSVNAGRVSGWDAAERGGKLDLNATKVDADIRALGIKKGRRTAGEDMILVWRSGVGSSRVLGGHG